MSKDFSFLQVKIRRGESFILSALEEKLPYKKYILKIYNRYKYIAINIYTIDINIINKFIHNKMYNKHIHNKMYIL